MQSDAANVPYDSTPDVNPATSQEIQTAPPPTPQTRERQRRWLPAVALLLLLTGLGLGWRWWVSRTAGAAGQGAGMQQPQGLPVKLATVQTATVLDASEFIGSLEAENSVELRSEITGRVSQVFVSKGERVRAGTPLVQLRPDEQAADLASLQASVNAARATRANARSELEAVRADRIAQAAEVELQTQNFQRISTLVSRGALSQQDLDQARRDRDTAIAQLSAVDRRIQAAQAGLAEAEAGVAEAQANAQRSNAQLQNTTITAPIDGIVGDIPADVGDVVTNSDLLTSITRNQSLNLRLSVPLERAPDLRTGQRVELIDNQGTVLQSGVISFIAPRVEGNAQSILAEATFDNPSGQLRDGQFVRARLIWNERPGILVPSSAITRLAGEPFIYVAKKPDPAASQAPGGEGEGDTKEGQPQSPPQAGGQAPALVAEQRQVELGNIQGNSYQVIKGLEAGEQIVISGILNLSDGAPIIPAPPENAASQGAPGQPAP